MMMSDSALRREARRQKILQNAEIRLKKLSGVEDKPGVTIDGFKAPNLGKGEEAKPESLLKEEFPNPKLEEKPNSEIFNNLMQNGALDNLLKENSSVNKARFETRNAMYKLWVIFYIAIFTNLSIILSKLYLGESEFISYYNKIFIPLFCYEIITLYFGETKPAPSLLMLLFLNGNRHRFVKDYIIYLQYVEIIMQDVFLYFFAFSAINGLVTAMIQIR